MWRMGLVAPRHVGSSQTRARTRVPCTGRRILKPLHHQGSPENVSLFEAPHLRPLVLCCGPAPHVPHPRLGLASKSCLPFQPLWALLICYPKVSHLHVLTERKGRKTSIFPHGVTLLFTSLVPLNQCHFGLSLLPKEAFKSSILWKPRANPLF